jgi:hypothetical protein
VNGYDRESFWAGEKDERAAWVAEVKRRVEDARVRLKWFQKQNTAGEYDSVIDAYTMLRDELLELLEWNEKGEK